MEDLKLICPECKSTRKMKKTKGGFYQCQNPKCRGYYMPQSCFGIT